ncbi:MAG TPA: ABC transporter permease, partial [Firmicutes bacterium]|nr:ABC transporter permease [Bacillota bacterium]
MIISLKDSFKLFGISIVCFCAVFVCTFFLNYYIDIVPLKNSISDELMPLYKAQLATAKMTCGITGGFLSIIAGIMLIFYIKLYIDNHCKAIGIFKAMGYSNIKIAKSFTLFGLSVLVGCGLGFALGWAFMPLIYKTLTIEGLPNIHPTFNISLLFLLVFAPAIIFTLIAFLYAAHSLKIPA